MCNPRFKYLVIGFAVLLAFLLGGCGGQEGQGQAEPAPPLVQQTYMELCSLCHASGRTADVAEVHAQEITQNRQTEITAVTEATSATDPGVVPEGEIRLKVAFRISESGNPLVPVSVPANDIRFTIAKLTQGSGEQRNWASYINTTETREAGDPGTTPEGFTALQATSERASASGGTFVNHADGSYTYIFSFDMQTRTNPLTHATIAYNRSLTHRVAMQVAGNIGNASFDFVPNQGQGATRNVVANASCDECHIKLGAHGGDRIAVNYCVTCHNPGTTDANSGNTVNFGILIHKLHRGENLPQVQAGGKYIIWGFGDSENDYSDVAFPQDIRNCIKCHDGTPGAPHRTTDGDNWKTVPSVAMCTSCHEAPDSSEFPGFPNLTPQEIADAHKIPEQVAAAKFKYNILRIANQANDLKVNPGDLVKVTFSVTNPENGDMAYDILKDPEFTAPAGASRLAVLIGWETTDYTNTGSGTSPAQPVSINPLARGTATDNGDGTFTVKSTIPIPATVAGSGVVGIEGHPAVETTPGSGVYDLRVPVTSVVAYFPITDSAAEPRREVVSIDNCNKCHGLLSLHGGNRNNQTQLCVICHNPDATDFTRRPANPAGAADGKSEEAIDFKYMIHGIHGAEIKEKGIVIYGFGNTPNDFSGVKLPSGINNIRNCQGCHVNGTFEVPLGDTVLPTTVKTGIDKASPNDDTNITPTASVCSSCHDRIESKTHMTEEGGKFDFIQFITGTAGQGGNSQLQCGPGPVSAQPPGHSSRTDCCSCHGS